MFNTKTFFGTDGIMTLSQPPNGADPSPITSYFGETGVVGRLKNISITIRTEIKPFHELGSRAPKELRAGNINISGMVERAHINGAMLKLMLGEYASGEETQAFKAPKFDVRLELNNLQGKAEGEGNSILTLLGVMFDTWQFSLPEDDFVLERLTFQAHRITSEDVELAA